MTTHRSRLFAAAFLGAILSLTLTGCNEAVDAAKEKAKEALRGFLVTSCKVMVEEVMLTAEEEYLKFAAEKCAALREKAHENLLNENRSDDLERKCLDAAGVVVVEDGEKQETNYTEQCIQNLNNATNEGWDGIQKMIDDLSTNNDWKEHLKELLNSDVMKKIDDFAKEQGLDSAKTESGSTEKPSDGTEKPSDGTEKPSDGTTAAETTKKPEVQDDKNESGVKLFDSSVDIPRPPGGVDGVAVLGLIGGVTMVAFGVAVRLRQGVRPRSGHDVLAGEGSEPGDA